MGCSTEMREEKRKEKKKDVRKKKSGKNKHDGLDTHAPSARELRGGFHMSIEVHGIKRLIRCPTRKKKKKKHTEIESAA